MPGEAHKKVSLAPFGCLVAGGLGMRALVFGLLSCVVSLWTLCSAAAPACGTALRGGGGHEHTNEGHWP